MTIELIVRLAGTVILAYIAWQLSASGPVAGLGLGLPFRYFLGIVGAALGILLTPWLVLRPLAWLRRGIRQVPTQSLIAGTIGLAVGLLISLLLAIPLYLLPAPFGRVLPLVAAGVLGYLGVTTVVTRQKELWNVFGSRFHLGAHARQDDEYILLDTSVIIDGRIADITQTGFIQGTMLVPRFVLNELQHIADSSDALRRNRGRRGLDILNRMQKESEVPIEITDLDAEEASEVDAKLVLLAKTLACPVMTNDYNLNRVAEFEGVRVLNINQLANAVKTVVLPGESIKVRIIQEGREIGQGVGYLDDGTMVVVENGRKYISSTMEVTVTRVLQTQHGRMIFATPNGSSIR